GRRLNLTERFLPWAFWVFLLAQVCFVPFFTFLRLECYRHAVRLANDPLAAWNDMRTLWPAFVLYDAALFGAACWVSWRDRWERRVRLLFARADRLKAAGRRLEARRIYWEILRIDRDILRTNREHLSGEKQ